MHVMVTELCAALWFYISTRQHVYFRYDFRGGSTNSLGGGGVRAGILQRVQSPRKGKSLGIVILTTKKNLGGFNPPRRPPVDPPLDLRWLPGYENGRSAQIFAQPAGLRTFQNIDLASDAPALGSRPSII